MAIRAGLYQHPERCKEGERRDVHPMRYCKRSKRGPPQGEQEQQKADPFFVPCPDISGAVRCAANGTMCAVSRYAFHELREAIGVDDRVAVTDSIQRAFVVFIVTEEATRRRHQIRSFVARMQNRGCLLSFRIIASTSDTSSIPRYKRQKGASHHRDFRGNMLAVNAHRWRRGDSHECMGRTRTCRRVSMVHRGAQVLV